MNRAENTDKVVDSLPGYVTNYRNYLRWRYPSRYGIKKGTTGSSTNYTTDFKQSGADIADLGDPYEPKAFGK
jgi:hypothetical protein